MKKLTKEQLAEFWRNWEREAGESFMDYFIDDNINDIGIVLGYWAAKYPDLFKYIMKSTNYKVVWTYIFDCSNEYDNLECLVESFYKVYNDQDNWNEENYNKSIIPWCDLICGIDKYYERFIDWCKENELTII